MNRHERRKNKKLEKHIRGMTAIVQRGELVPPGAPYYLFCARQWFAQTLGGGRPLCLLCDHCWESVLNEPPACFFLTRAEDPTDTHNALVSSICPDCAGKGDLLTRCVDKLRSSIWPNLRAVDHVHTAPGAKQ
jgi:hypothetical protein